MERAMEAVACQHARLTARYKSPAEWLASHTNAMTEIRKAQRAADARIDKLVEAGRATDVRIEKLVSAVGELLRARSPRHAG
jgi:hypothetical protein